MVRASPFTSISAVCQAGRVNSQVITPIVTGAVTKTAMVNDSPQLVSHAPTQSSASTSAVAAPRRTYSIRLQGGARKIKRRVAASSSTISSTERV